MGDYRVDTNSIQEYMKDLSLVIISERRKKDEMFGATGFLKGAKWAKYVDQSLEYTLGQEIDDLIDRSAELHSLLNQYIADCDAIEERRKRAMEENGPEDISYGYEDIHFSMGNANADETFNPNYLEYTAYGFTMCGYSIQEYDLQEHIFTFMNSTGAAGLQFANITNWANYYKTIAGQGDLISNEYMRTALKSILDAVPDPEGYSVDMFSADFMDLGLKNLFSDAKKYTGDWAKIYELRQKIAEGRVNRQLENNFEIELAEKFIEMGEKGDLLIKFLKGASDRAKAAGKVFTITDNLMYLMNHICADYTNQLAYLDTMEEALTAMGYSAASAREVIGQVRGQYTSLAADMLMKNIGEIEKFASGQTSAVLGAIPGLREASMALGIGSDIVSITQRDNIKAADALYGFVQYDQALCNRFTVFQDKMIAGTISSDEMQEADKLFDLIRSTKMKEYESLITLKENGFDVGDISLTQLKNQLEELQGMSASGFANTMQKTSTAELGAHYN